MVLKERDIKLLEMIEKFKIIDVPRAIQLVKEYPKPHTVRRRLKKLYDEKHINKKPSTMGQYQIYYIKPVKQIEHRLLLIDFYLLLSSMFKVLEFETEYKVKGSPGIRRKDDIIADAYVVLQREDGKKATFIIEVQRSTNPLNFQKYKSLEIPPIIAITNNKIEIPKEYNVLVIDTKFKRLKEVLG